MQHGAPVQGVEAIAGDRPVGPGDMQLPAVGQGADAVTGGERHHVAARWATRCGAGAARAEQTARTDSGRGPQQLPAARSQQPGRQVGARRGVAHVGRGYQACKAGKRWPWRPFHSFAHGAFELGPGPIRHREKEIALPARLNV